MVQGAREHPLFPDPPQAQGSLKSTHTNGCLTFNSLQGSSGSPSRRDWYGSVFAHGSEPDILQSLSFFQMNIIGASFLRFPHLIWPSRMSSANAFAVPGALQMPCHSAFVLALSSSRDGG
jgi:hypothetical protein